MKTTFSQFLSSLLLLLLPLCAQAQSISKSGPATADATSEEIFTYTINFTCPSTTAGDCDNAVITDVLPPEVEYVNSTVGSSESGGTVTFPLGTVPNGATRSVEINVRFPDDTFTGTEASNEAIVTFDGNTGETSNTVITTSTGGQDPLTFTDDIIFRKYEDAASPINQQGEFSMSIGNRSETIDYTNVVIEDIIPDGLFIEGIWLATQGVNCSPDYSYTVEVYVFNTTTNTGTWVAMTSGFTNNDFDTSNDERCESCDFAAAVGMGTDEYVKGIRVTYPTLPSGGCMHPDNPDFNGSIQLDVAYDEAVTGFPDPDPNDTFTNCGTLNADGQAEQTECATMGLIQVEPNIEFNKNERSSGPYAPGDEIIWQVRLGTNPESGYSFTNPLIIDVLPPELEFTGIRTISMPGSTTINPGSTSEDPIVTGIVLPDGSTEIRFEWDDALGNGITISPTGDFNNGRIEYYTRVKANAIDGSTLENNITMYVDDTPLVFDCRGSSEEFDTADVDGDGITDEEYCVHNADAEILLPPGFAGLNSYKEVRGNRDTDFSRFPSSGNVNPGGQIDYNICLDNPANLTENINNLVLVDVLPHVGDIGVVANDEDRESEWQPTFIAATVTTLTASLPADAVIYYSTVCNPCLNADLGVSDAAGCSAPAWSTTPPADLSTVCAFKVEFASTTILAPGDQLCFTYEMVTPTTAPSTGEIAWNSFGFVGTKEDGTSLLASEPIKVGIKTFAAATPPACEISGLNKNNETCNDNGTPDTTDDYITFDLAPFGVNLGASYTVTADNGGTVTLSDGSPATAVAYGAISSFRLQNGSADGATTYTITVTDNDNTCQNTTTVMQNNCAGGGGASCSLTDAGETLETCNDNSTSTDATDDYITFSLNPVGTGTAATYSVSVDNGGVISLAAGGAATGISYGSATAFRLQNGSADGTSTYTVTVTDDGTASCQTTTTVIQNNCAITLYSLGNRVFFDDDNSGTQNGTEQGVAGVTLQLLNADGSSYDADPNTTAIEPLTVVTANGGYYRFDELPAGNYIVEISPAIFGAGMTLENFVSSDGAGQESNPNADSDENDNGLDTPAASGAIRSGVITLGGVEPTGETEPGTYDAVSTTGAAAPDTESNLTVDFGFYRQRDRSDFNDPNRPPCADDPCHFISSNIYFGSGVTADNGSMGTNTADTDLDDGILINDNVRITPGGQLNLPVVFYNNTGATAYVLGWIDWNGDSDFDDAGEQVANLTYNPPSYTGGTFTEYIPIGIPTDAQQNTNLAMRWRISTDNTASASGACGTGDCANDGEVEDYLLRVTCPTVACPAPTLTVRRN